MKFTVSKACNYYFSLKWYILVKIIYPFSLDFCPSKQQVNKWLHGDCLEEIREGERSTKPVVKKKLFPMEHVSFTTKTAKSPMSAKVKTENNDGNNVSPLGHSTGTQALRSRV